MLTREGLAEIAAELAQYSTDPLSCILAAFPWGEGELAGATGPRAWQQDELRQIGKHLSNPATRCTPYYSATVSGNGPGKSALVAMISKWALSTCEDTRVIVMANTGAQLATKTQPEVAKWFRLAIDHDLWDVQATRITYLDIAHKSNWRLDFETWREQNPEAIGGLHNQGKRIVIIFDEASAIPRVIWDYIQGALTDEDTEILWFAFGNGTLNEGPFYECFNKNRHLWHTRQIDTRTISGVNQEEINRWIEEDGEDSDWVRIHVRGLFPRRSELQFIGHDVIKAARHYIPVGYEALPKILACDVARFGGDETVFGLRQGRHYQQLETYRKQDTHFTGNRLCELIRQHKPAITVVDADGIGGAVVDYARALKFNVMGFNGSAQAYQPQRFGNRRAEIWSKGKAWLEGGASIPDDETLAHQLAAPHYYYRTGASSHGSLMIERKEDMKRRGEASPDKADTLMLTLAFDPQPEVETEDNRDRRHALAHLNGPQGWLGV